MKNKIVNILGGFLVLFVALLIGRGLVRRIDLVNNRFIGKDIQEISESEKAKKYCDLEIIADFTTKSDGYIDNNRIYYDKNTGVMYYRMSNAMFPILNSDGTPKLYEGELN